MPVAPASVSPLRPVPDHIPRPDYAASGMPSDESGPAVTDPGTIDRIRKAGELASSILIEAGELVHPGITTDKIDEFVHQRIVESGAYPSTLNYKGFAKSCCTSVNEVICHGIPDARRLLNGDIVNIDVTAFLDGVHGDVDATYPVGTVHPDYLELLDVTREALDQGIQAVEPGLPVSVIGRAIEAHASRHGYSVVRAFSGHGVGELFHNGLSIPHFYDPSFDTELEPGMVFTIEPMIAIGTWQHLVWPDGWTAVTADRKRTAQFEHTVALTADGVEVLTRHS